jgi:hypothetical protein
MEVKTVLITMLSCGVIGSVAEKVSISFGKSEVASFINIATICGVGITALGLVASIIKLLSSL